MKLLCCHLKPLSTGAVLSFVITGDSGGAIFLGDPTTASAKPLLVGVINLGARCYREAFAQRTDVESSRKFLKDNGVSVPDV